MDVRGIVAEHAYVGLQQTLQHTALDTVGRRQKHVVYPGFRVDGARQWPDKHPLSKHWVATSSCWWPPADPLTCSRCRRKATAADPSCLGSASIGSSARARSILDTLLSSTFSRRPSSFFRARAAFSTLQPVSGSGVHVYPSRRTDVGFISDSQVSIGSWGNACSQSRGLTMQRGNIWSPGQLQCCQDSCALEHIAQLAHTPVCRYLVPAICRGCNCCTTASTAAAQLFST